MSIRNNPILSTIKARGLILIFVPLLFETLCGLTLFWLQGYYESKLLEQKRTSALISYANYIWMESISLITHSLRSRISTSHTKVGKREESIGIIESNIKLIEDGIGSDKKENSELQKMKSTFEHICKISAEMVTEAPVSDSGIQQMMVLKDDIHRIKIMQKLLRNMGREIQRLKLPLEKKAIQAKKSVLATRSNIKIALAITSVADVLLAAVLLFYFLQVIYKGIKVLHTNTIRLSQSQPLLPELTTGDELAELDRTFHEMARSVEAARSRELATINNSADMICVLDKQARLNLVNPATERLLHRGKDELLGTEVSKFCLGSDKSILEAALETIKCEQKPGAFECRIQHDSSESGSSKSDSSKSDSSDSAPNNSDLNNNNNNVLHSSWNVSWSEAEQEFFCVVHDITERKKLEELRRVFVAMVSHDLRTPLTSIQIFLSNLEAGIFGDVPVELRQSVQETEAAARKLITLISEFLDFEKLAAGKMPLDPRLIYVETAFEEAVEQLNERLGESAPEIEIPESDLEIWTDPNLIGKVLLHLCLKATEFSDGSPMKLTAAETEAGIEIHLTFAACPDSTIGSAEIGSAEIFEQGSTPVFSGLGLPLAKQIVNLHQGTISFTPDPKPGFHFKLPLPPS